MVRGNVSVGGLIFGMKCSRYYFFSLTLVRTFHVAKPATKAASLSRAVLGFGEFPVALCSAISDSRRRVEGLIPPVARCASRKPYPG